MMYLHILIKKNFFFALLSSNLGSVGGTTAAGGLCGKSGTPVVGKGRGRVNPGGAGAKIFLF